MLYFTSLSLHQIQFQIPTTIEVARYRTEKGNRDAVFHIIITVKYIIMKTMHQCASVDQYTMFHHLPRDILFSQANFKDLITVSRSIIFITPFSYSLNILQSIHYDRYRQVHVDRIAARFKHSRRVYKGS